jgi:hypothetical protein
LFSKRHGEDGNGGITSPSQSKIRHDPFVLLGIGIMDDGLAIPSFPG